MARDQVRHAQPVALEGDRPEEFVRDSVAETYVLAEELYHATRDGLVLGRLSRSGLLFFDEGLDRSPQACVCREEAAHPNPSESLEHDPGVPVRYPGDLEDTSHRTDAVDVVPLWVLYLHVLLGQKQNVPVALFGDLERGHGRRTTDEKG